MQPQSSTPPTNNNPNETPATSRGEKVIQPTSEFKERIQASRQQEATSYPAPEPFQSPRTDFDINSIYPNTTSAIVDAGQPSPSPFHSKQTLAESTTFEEGWSIGGTIFWLQFFVGIVFGLVFSGINNALLKSATTSVIEIVSLFYYLVEFVVVGYIPYRILKNNDVVNSFWLTTFGVAIQAIMIASLFELFNTLILRSVIKNGSSISPAHIGVAGIGAIAIISFVGLLIAGYFLTKTSWGLSFSLFDKIKNKVIAKIIGMAIVSCIVGSVAYHYISSIPNVVPNIQQSALISYSVSQSSPPFLVKFYENAQVSQKNGLTYLISTDGNGKETAIWITTLTSPTSCAGQPQFSFTFDNQSTSGCYTSSREVYAALVGLNGSMYQVSLTSQKPINIADASAIYNSLVIQ